VLARDPKLNAPNLVQWLHHADTAAVRLEHEGALDASLKPYDQLSQLNVLVQLEHLMSYGIVKSQVAAGALVVSGWWFDIAAGSMYVYERSSRSFEIIDRAVADRLVKRLAARVR